MLPLLPAVSGGANAQNKLIDFGALTRELFSSSFVVVIVVGSGNRKKKRNSH